jgi:hypothetical protein
MVWALKPVPTSHTHPIFFKVYLCLGIFLDYAALYGMLGKTFTYHFTPVVYSALSVFMYLILF